MATKPKQGRPAKPKEIVKAIQDGQMHIDDVPEVCRGAVIELVSYSSS